MARRRHRGRPQVRRGAREPPHRARHRRGAAAVDDRRAPGAAHGRVEARAGGDAPARAGYQALRIEVNSELAELESILHAANRLLKPGGRLAVMSYHSLEDRRVKRFLRSGTFSDVPPPQDPFGNVLAPWKPLTRRAVVAGAAEVDANPRARSARLRVGERTEHDAPAGVR